MASGGAKILSGKAALITGGSRGIGRAVAAAYAQAGAEVFICGRDERGVAAALREIAEAGGSIDGAAGDVGNRADAERLVWAALERFGRVDVLVNNASILGPRQELADYPIGAWEEVLRINLTG